MFNAFLPVKMKSNAIHDILFTLSEYRMNEPKPTNQSESTFKLEITQQMQNIRIFRFNLGIDSLEFIFTTTTIQSKIV